MTSTTAVSIVQLVFADTSLTITTNEPCAEQLMNYKHGMSRNPLYKVWGSIRRRCTDRGFSRFGDWGGRGISLCAERAHNPLAFIAYVESELGTRPSRSHSLDRIDNDRGYEPGNLKWSTNSEQTRNSRHARLITALGKTQHLEVWANELGVNKSTLHGRAHRYGDEVAITMSIKQTQTT